LNASGDTIAKNMVNFVSVLFKSNTSWDHRELLPVLIKVADIKNAGKNSN